MTEIAAARADDAVNSAREGLAAAQSALEAATEAIEDAKEEELLACPLPLAAVAGFSADRAPRAARQATDSCPGARESRIEAESAAMEAEASAESSSTIVGTARGFGEDAGRANSNTKIIATGGGRISGECEIVASGGGRPASSRDPNSIDGPEGFIAPDQTLPYTIHFENLATATAPAIDVVVTLQLDADLDFSSFELGPVGFGNVVVAVPAGLGSFSTRVALAASASIGGDPLLVDIAATINLQTGFVQWTFRSLDQATLDVPSNPFAGFLPPNATAPEGEGFVGYTVRPRSGLATGTEIRAIATIVFDTNDPITTNQIDPQDASRGTDPAKEVPATIDAGRPIGAVDALPAVINATTFTVSWSGSDDPGGSGIASFDVFVSDNGGPFAPFQVSTSDRSTEFTGEFGHTYDFFAVATDNVGHSETERSAAAEATTRLGSSNRKSRTARASPSCVCRLAAAPSRAS